MLLKPLRNAWRRITDPHRHSARAANIALGYRDYQQRSFDTALAALRKALAGDAADADVHYAIAKCHRALGNLGDMHATLSAALAANADHLPSHQLLSDIALPGPDYRERISAIHDRLQPRLYLEIGVAHGRTIALARPATIAIGVDPNPRIEQPLGPNVRIFALPSDEFFARSDLAAIFNNRSLDLAFIDGMHNFEYSLRDFIGVERLCAATSTILIHDTYPLDRATSARDRTTVFWSGDTWRLVLALRKYRPDLALHTIRAAPTGLTVVRNLDPGSRVLAEQLEAIVAEFLAVDYGVLEQDKAATLNAVPNDWDLIGGLLDGASDRSG